MEGQVKAVIYCRISRDPDGTELGVRRQEDDARELCATHNLEIVHVYVDDDRSAYSGKPRPGFVAMCERLEAGDIDVVVAWHPDRLTRHPRELEDLIELLDRTGTSVRTVQTGEYDLGTPSGKMAARIVGAVARHESEHKSARLRRKHLELAQAGKVSGGGDRPFGFDDDRVTIREDEADLIRHAAQRVILGDSVRAVAGWMSEGTGKKWTSMSLRRMLMSARIAGLRSHRGVVRPAIWDAIISENDHRRLVALLSDPERVTNRGNTARKLLTGVAHCGECGLPMVSRPSGRKVASYICSPDREGACGARKIMGEPLDDLISQAVLERLDTAALDRAMDAPADDGAILAELDALAGRAETLATKWALGEVSESEWAAASIALTRRQAELEEGLRAATASRARRRPDVVSIRVRWPSMSIEERRDVIEAVVDRVVIGPGVKGRNRFDPSRVSIEWQH